ncbi:MAG: 5'-nucleotidase C-terminal domain-containing protein [Gudongella sp.]|nr:5'-nucleotidase C-terminal domain-containing protein [Gudongella sp.]
MLRNKRIVSWVLSLVLVLGLMVMPSGVAFAAENQTLTIVHVNDVHGRLAEDDYEGALGYAKLKTKVDELKAEDPNLLFLNAGDVFHGTTLINVTRGETMVEAMNLMGFDAMVPGNHDFNYGYDRLIELKEMAEFPIIAANVVKEVDQSTDFDPYVIYTMDNGLKVGIFGLATDETKYKSHPDNTIGIEFTDVVEVSKEIVKELQDMDVDFIIALSHLGIDASSVNTATLIANEVEGIDMIVDGHSHDELTEGLMINDVLVVQAGSYTKNIGIVNLEFEDKAWTNYEAKLIPYEEAKDLAADQEILDIIEEIELINEPIVSVVVGNTPVELDGLRENVRTGETNLGNLITDAMRESTGADVAFTNGGGIRASIAAGDIKVNDILTAFPFTNTLAVIEVTGAELMEAVEHGVKDFPAAAGQFPHVSGMKYVFDASMPVGERVTSLMIGEEPVDLNMTYKLVTNDFMAAGGDGYTMFEGKPFVGEGGLLSDILIEYVEEAGTVNPMVEGRIVATNVPVIVPEPTPVPTPEPTPVPSPEYKEYVVKSGDWLSKIGSMYNVEWRVLAEYNSLKNPNLIFPNQIIKIPQ